MQAPSTVNNCARELMSAIRTQWDDAVWFNFYPTSSPTIVSLKAQNKIRISQQSAASTYTATDIYPIGTRLKVINSNTTKYGSVISLSSSSTAVMLTMTMDSGTLTSTISIVSRSIITPTNSPVPTTIRSVKFWLKATSVGTIQVSFNITSVNDAGTGDIDVVIAKDFSSADYVITSNCEKDATTSPYVYVTIDELVPPTAGTFSAFCAYNSTTLIDPNFWLFAGFGDQ